MDAERWEQIESLYHNALQLAPDEREKFLREACGEDKSLLGEVKTLLMFQEKNVSFLENPALNQAAKLLVTHQNQLAFGQTFANYKVLTLLGAGGMGEVYLAEDNFLKRKVALKVLPLSLVSNQNLVQRFQKEARAASVLNHPNILTVYEIGQDKSGLHYIATEYIEGETLRQILSNGKELDLSQILDIGLQIVSGLSAAHRAGVIHRDIKPQNVMVRSDGYVKILDFGIAKLIENEAHEDDRHSSLRTEAGMILGTANYMSPEQARGLKVDARTDIWSLGVTLYELITHQAPFTGDTTTDIIVSILQHEPPPIKEIAPDAPAELINIINKCLQKNAADRFQSVDEIIAELIALKENPAAVGALKIAARPTAKKAGVKTEENNSTTAEDEVKQKRGFSSAGKRSTSSFSRVIFRPYAAVVAVVLTFAVGISLAYSSDWLKKLGSFILSSKSVPAFQNAQPKLETAAGNVLSSHVSPDGKYLAYIVDGGGQHSLWVKQIAAPPPRMIFPANGNLYRGLTFSPDGNFIYFTVHEKSKGRGALYSIPIFGGEPRRILEDIDSPVTFSPDGKSFAYLFEDSTKPINQRILRTAPLDGSAVKTIAVSEGASLFVLEGFAWLEKTNSIVIGAARAADASTKYMHLVEINVADGTVKDFGTGQWEIIGRVTALKNGNLIFSCVEKLGTLAHLIELMQPDGEVRKVINDLNNYSSVSITADGKNLFAVQTNFSSHLWAAPTDKLNDIKRITPNIGKFSSTSWTPEGKIIYSSTETGNQDIWIMEGDGSNPKQLTFDSAIDISPKVSPDGRYVVFVSNRSGVFNLWRMDRDGGSLKKLTSGLKDEFPYFSADSKFVYYQVSADGRFSVAKVSIDGEAIKTFNSLQLFPATSADGQWLLTEYVDETINKQWDLAIFSTADDALRQVIERPTQFYRPITRWMPDSANLSYISVENSIQNLWSYSVKDKTAKRLTDFNSSDGINYYDWSSDGKKLLLLRGTTVRDIISLNP